MSAFFSHCEKSSCAVRTHARKYDTHCITRRRLCNRLKQNIYRRTMTADFFALVTSDRIPAVLTHKFHMLVPRCYKNLTCFYSISILRLFYMNPALFIKTFSIHLCKARRHMLHYNRPRNIRIEIFYHGKYRFCSSCRCSYGNYLVVILPVYIVWRDSNLLFFFLRIFNIVGCLYLCYKLAKNPLSHLFAVHIMWLLYIINSSVFYIIKNLMFHRTYHYNFHGMLRNKLFHKIYAIHPRHLYI